VIGSQELLRAVQPTLEQTAVRETATPVARGEPKNCAGSSRWPPRISITAGAYGHPDAEALEEAARRTGSVLEGPSS